MMGERRGAEEERRKNPFGKNELRGRKNERCKIIINRD
jgi:hypothetical protein